jgi:hypothetical protein
MTQNSALPVPASSRSPLKRFLTSRRVWALLIVLIGLGVMFFFGTRTLRAYRELAYAQQNGLLDGTASVDAIKPWMTIRYIAVAYAVPEEYLYAQLNIPYNERRGPRRDALGELARRPAPEGDPNPNGDNLNDERAGIEALIEQVRMAILDYRTNPVAPGLRDIRLWMSIAYIANSTGIPADYLVAQIDAALQAAPDPAPAMGQPLALLEDGLYKPLDQLVEDLKFPGGPRALEETLTQALEQYEAVPTEEPQ